MAKIWALGLIIFLFFIKTSPGSACPECGCWALRLYSQKRPYLKDFNRFPWTEKIVKIGEYRLCCSIIQLSDNIIDLLIYADNPQSQRPYTRCKDIILSCRQGGKLSECLRTLDSELVSHLRYIYQEPAKYILKVILETESTPLVGELELPLGSPPPSYTYLVILGIVFISVLGSSFYIKRPEKNASFQI